MDSFYSFIIKKDDYMTMREKDILQYIKEITDEEQRLFSKGKLSDEEKTRLEQLKIELDQYWDLLRQRRAKKEFGQDPDNIELRGPDTVENYEQ